MHFEPFDLLDRVLAGHAQARYDLSSSDMPPQRLRDKGGLKDVSLAENHVGGSEAFRGQLARMFGGRAEDYVVTCGASEANYAVCASLLGPGDPVLVETPTYQPLEAIPAAFVGETARLVRPESEGFRLSVDDVDRAIPSGLRLLVLSNLHNPSGAALDADTVRGIADLAADRGFYVLVDEIFRELAFDLDTPTMGGRNERTIVTSGVSKFYGAGGLRIGWVRAAPEVRRLVRRTLDYMSVAPAGPSEAIALSLLRRKARTAARNRRLIREGRRVAKAWAESTPEAHYEEPVAHLCFPRVDADSEALSRRVLADHSTFIAPGESFGAPGRFRLNLGGEKEQLEGGLARVTKALRQA